MSPIRKLLSWIWSVLAPPLSNTQCSDVLQASLIGSFCSCVMRGSSAERRHPSALSVSPLQSVWSGSEPVQSHPSQCPIRPGAHLYGRPMSAAVSVFTAYYMQWRRKMRGRAGSRPSKVPAEGCAAFRKKQQFFKEKIRFYLSRFILPFEKCPSMLVFERSHRFRININLG